MIKFTTAVLATIALTGPAAAADLLSKKSPPAPVFVTSPWDFAVGAGVTSNYIFRGISQSNRAPSVSANAEINYAFNDTFQAYVGAFGASIKFSDQQVALPSLELDALTGVRATFGNLLVDVGGVYYGYPNAGNCLTCFVVTNPSFFEGYTKLGYTINDMFSVGANVYYSPSFLDSGANATYASVTAKAALPMGFSLSGEFGRQYLGTADAVHGSTRYPDYNYWNAGVSYGYKFATLDLRYHDTNLSKEACSSITGTSGGSATQSKYCGAAYVATLSFAFTGKDIK
jgi:uncharacterized protein (TIGR02001 family)